MNAQSANTNTNPPPTKDPLPKGNEGGSKIPPRRTWIWFLALLVFNYFLMSLLYPDPTAPTIIPYTLFKEEVAKGNVGAVYSKGESVTGKFESPIIYPKAESDSTSAEAAEQDNFLLKRGEQQPVEVIHFSTTLPAFLDSGLENFLIEQDVEILATPLQEEVSPFFNFLIRFGPAILIIGFYIWLFRRASGGGMAGGAMMGIGKSKAKRFDQEKDKRVTFDDVAGIDEAENELVEIADLKNPDKYTRLGGSSPQRSIADRLPGNRENTPGPCRGRRSRSAVFFNERI